MTPQHTRITANGYEVVSLAGRQYLIHRVIADYYILNPDNKPCVNHKDGKKLNNDPSNLEWVTYQENTRHAFDTGLVDWKKMARPQDDHWRPVQATDGSTVFRFRSISEASARLGALRTAIINCLNGRTSTCAGYRWEYIS